MVNFKVETGKIQGKPENCLSGSKENYVYVHVCVYNMYIYI